jgi:glucokinase
MSTHTIGVDVGGTKIAAGLVDVDGQVLATERTESPAKHPSEIVRTIGGLVERLGRGHDVEAVGVSAAGFVDKDRGTVLFAPNLAWRDEPLKKLLEHETGLPVVAENDANAAAWGEFTFGAGADIDDLLMLTIGTGVGGGVVLDGELMRGGFGIAAEVGHIRMVPDGVPCGCGNRGCLESYASGRALVRRSQEEARDHPDAAAALLEAAGGSVEAITGPLVTDAAHRGDPFAVARFTELGDWLGQGLATLVAVLDPTVVVIGGGVGEAGDLLLDPARRSFAANVTGHGHRPLLEVRAAQLGNAGGMIGAADLARRR